MSQRSLDMLGLSPTPPLSILASPEERSFQDELDYATVMPESFASRRIQASMDVNCVENLTPLTRQNVRNGSSSRPSGSSKWPWLDKPRTLVSSLIGRKDSASKDDTAAGLVLAELDGKASSTSSVETVRKAFDQPEVMDGFDSDVLYDGESQSPSNVATFWEDAPSDNRFYGEAMVAAVKSAEACGEYREDMREARFKHTLHATTTEIDQLEAAGELRQLYTRIHPSLGCSRSGI